MHFASPYCLWLLTLLVPLTVYYVWRTMQGGASIRLSSVDGLAGAPKTLRYWLRHLPFVLRLAALALAVVALARPQGIEQNARTNTEGIDIMLAVDVSGSMLARDFKPDRITAAKEVAVHRRPLRRPDRPGRLRRRGLHAEPPDHGPEHPPNPAGPHPQRSDRGRHGHRQRSGHGHQPPARKRSPILLTDGVNNRGEIAPVMAAEIAKAQGIRVYTIGVGTEGMAPYPAVDMFGNMTFVQQKVEIDEKNLRQIAESTGGRYFRATDKAKLKAIYDEINQLEKSKVEVFEHITYHELYLGWLLAALALLAAEFLLAQLVLKRIP